MSTEENDASLVGLDWETWQRVTQTRGLTAASGTNYDAAAMPSQKAICYGFYPSIELESMLLINCKKCGLLLKDVGYGHHMRSQHGYHINSGSGDECQSFLLSPPHRVVSPRLEIPILSPPYRRLSTPIASPIASPKEGLGRSGSIISQTTSTRYSVEQKDDLKLSLRVSRHEVSFPIDPAAVSSEASGQNNSTFSNDTKGEVRTSTKVNKRLNGKAKDKKAKKRRRDSSDEDNFSLEHFRQKKLLAKKEQSAGEANKSTSNNVLSENDNAGDSHICNSDATTSQNAKASIEINEVPAEAASASVLLSTDEKVQSTTALKSIEDSESLQKENEEIYDLKEQTEAVANCLKQLDKGDLDADVSKDVTTFPTVESEKRETQQDWTPDVMLSLKEDSVNESHLCEKSNPHPDSHRFYVPSPPQLSPVVEKEGCMIDSMTAPTASPQEDIYHGPHVEENRLLRIRERIIPNGYRGMGDVSQPLTSYPNEDQDLNRYNAVHHRCAISEQDEKNASASHGYIETRYPIQERIVATGPCFYGYPRGEISENGRSRRLSRNEEDYVGSEFGHKTHPSMKQEKCVPHQQPRLVSASLFLNSMSYRDVYIDPEQKLYYPNARLLTVPINGKTTVGYPPQARSPPPSVSLAERNHRVHDLPDDVERLPQLTGFHSNVIGEMHREMRNQVQLATVGQELPQHFDQISGNLRSERNRLSSGRNSGIKITKEAVSEHPYDCSAAAPMNLHGTRSSNYAPHMIRKKGSVSRVFRAVRPHTDTTQQAATSQITPHEVCVPIHGKTIIRPEYRYVYIPSKSSHSSDLDHIYNRQRKDRERERNEFGCSEVRHAEHQSRIEPTIRHVAIQKVQPTVSSRVRPLTTTNEGVRTVKVPIHRRFSHHHSSSITEKTVVFHPELRNERNSHPATSIGDVVRINSKERIYPACGLQSYAAAGNVQRGASVTSRSKQRSNCTSYQIQQNTASRQAIRKTKVAPPADDMESRFGGICLLMRHGFLKSPKDFYCLSK
ncbi:unnamed protein product [Litomosoides sigmodontis]|uniref:Uncharacterized protein n=1 Tax=Litomosoides sigmodontis TaxID=42156 RepID=A0A3P7M5Q5_LITSI|nr:unnamed protein product [Litomosoides sigmodontis]